MRKLKKRVKNKKRSMTNECRTIASDSIGNDMEDVIKEIRLLRAEFAGRKFSDSVELLRVDRER